MIIFSMYRIRFLLLLCSLFIILSQAVEAQSYRMSPLRVGVELNPKLAWMSPTYVQVKRDGVSMGAGARFFFDYFINYNIAISTGIGFNSMQATLSVFDSTSYAIETAHYKMNYIGVPVSGKFLSDNVADNLKILAEVGVLFEYNVSSAYSLDRHAIPGIAQSNPLNLSVMLGAGVEYFINRRNSLAFHLSYVRGFSNVVSMDAAAERLGGKSGGDVTYESLSVCLGYAYILNRRKR